MYKLIKEDGVHASAISDALFVGLAGMSRPLYEYDGPDPEAAPGDVKNQEIDAENASDGISQGNDGKPNFITKEVTQEDLDNNPALVEAGVAIGDTIEIPVADKKSKSAK